MKLAAVLCLGWLGLTAPAVADDLVDGFVSPPVSAAPWTYWHWMNGNVTKVGITADLEAMRRVGIRSAIIVVLGGKPKIGIGAGPGWIPPGPVKFLSPQFLEMVRFAAAEGKRVGVSIGMGDSAGWSSSGGPWVTPENSMQELVSSARTVEGPSHFFGTLPQPETKLNFYRDVRVVAFPALGGGDLAGQAKITASADDFQDPNAPGRFLLPYAQPGQPSFLQFEFASPVTLRTVVFDPDWSVRGDGKIEASDDGLTFRPAGKFTMIFNGGRVTCALPATSARFFRVIFFDGRGLGERMSLENVRLLSTALIDRYQQKTVSILNRIDDADLPDATPMPPDSMVIQPARMIDLSARMDAAGKLTWDVPTGRWTVMRFGYTTTGMTNHPAPPEATGLECNKLSRPAAQAFWAGVFGPLKEKLGPLLGTSFNNVLIDSYEVGGQDWSPTFAEDFRARRGYDLLPYLPVFSGQIVENADVSNRVLWDVRRTVADLFAENYYGTMAQLAHRSGLTLEVEPYGNGPLDELRSGRDVDRIMTEFWWEHTPAFRLFPKMVASIAHIYGKAVVASEAFTSDDGGWDMSPPTLKAQGDHAFADGVNSFTFHRYTMQPWLDRWPGMTMGHNGSNLDRTTTWWEPGRAWMQYLARCQFLLQQGRFVGDVLFFPGEGAPSIEVDPPRSQLPAGYDYDSCDTDVILHRLTVRKGRLMLPNGASYRVLVLPDGKKMTPELLRRLKELAEAGATILGPKPERSPSLRDYPECDAEVKQLADELWDGGKIRADKTLPEALAEMKVAPDFESATPGINLLYLHRQTDDADIYFVSNQAGVAQDTDGLFRVSGKIPELWHPDTGRMEPAAAWSQEDGRTRVPLHFDPTGSVFVVFREAATSAAHPVALVAPAEAEPGHQLTIQRAIYLSDNQVATDVTSQLANQVRKGRLEMKVTSELVNAPGDPDSQSHLTVDYTLDGQAAHQTLMDGGMLEIAAPGPLFPAAALVADEDGVKLRARQAGDYTVKMSDRTQRSVSIGAVSAPEEIAGPWTVSFPPHWGAPAQATFPTLISWSDSADIGVKYFSGTATYHKIMTIPAEWLGKGRQLDLDLGDVQVIAEVKLNGRDLGILWKAPYAVDITGAARAGDNDLEVKVTNLWANRIIGDEQLPEDSDRSPQGWIKSWPQWLLDDQPSPTGRFTFATWRYWKKNDPLLPSGLIGPVRLRPAVEAAVK